MKYLSISCPLPSKGRPAMGKKMVVPDQSMSLEEILARFTRGEAVPIGRDGSYHESEDDLEKVSRMDLVDKAEFVEKLKQTQKDFEKQERRKEKLAREKLLQDAKDQLKKDAEKAPKAD